MAQEGLDPSLQKMLEIIQDFYGLVQDDMQQLLLI